MWQMRGVCVCGATLAWLRICAGLLVNPEAGAHLELAKASSPACSL